MKTDAARRHLGAVLLLGGIVLAVVFYIGLGTMKIDYHTDEYFTYQIANGYSASWQIPQYEWFAPDSLTEQLTVHEGGRFSVADVIEKEKSDMHPFLYTLIIHLLCSFMPGQFSPWIGLGVNMVFAALTMVMLYLCLRRLSVSLPATMAAVLIFAFCSGTASQVMFIRMYVIIMFLNTCVVYLHIRYWDDEKNWHFFPLLALVSICGALTHYYFVAFLILCCVVYGIELLAARKFRRFLQYAATEAVSAVCAIALFPAMLNQVFGKGVSYSETASIPYLTKVTEFLSIMNWEAFGGLLWVLAAVTLLLCLLRAYRSKHAAGTDVRKEKHGLAAFLLLPAIVFVMLVAQISPYLTARYVSIIFPVVILTVFYLLDHVLQALHTDRRILLAAMSVLCVGCIGGSYLTGSVDSLFRSRADILSRTADRENRKAVLLIDDYCTWPIPSALTELIDYDSMLVIPYSSLGSEEAEWLLTDAGKTYNVYCYTWNVSEELLNEKLQQLMEITNSQSTYLWNSAYSIVYACTPAGT